jgi:hypothetical protein
MKAKLLTFIAKDSTMGYKPNATVIPGNRRNPPFLAADCNTSVTAHKSLRHSPISSYTLPVDDRVQAPAEAPIFLPQSLGIPVTHSSRFEPDVPVTLLFSDACTLLKTDHLQLTHSQPLAHSLKNIGGYGVHPTPHPFPFWERHPVPAFASQNAGLSPASWQRSVRQSVDRRTNDHSANNRASSAFAPSRFSLAIKKQSIPNLPAIAGNEWKANNVYKVFRRTVSIFFRR